MRGPAGSSSSLAHLWGCGETNAVDALDYLMKVRAAALRRFSEKNIREGAPLATIEDVLVPILHAAPVSGGSGEQVCGRHGPTPLRCAVTTSCPHRIVFCLRTAARSGRRTSHAEARSTGAAGKHCCASFPPRPVDYDPRPPKISRSTQVPAFDAAGLPQEGGPPSIHCSSCSTRSAPARPGGISCS